MGGGWQVRRVIGALLSLAMLGTPGQLEAQTQGPDDLPALRGQVGQLQLQGKFAEAIPIAERFVAMARQKHGEEHLEFASAIAWLASSYQGEGRYGEAEPLYKRSLAIQQKVLGPEHPSVGAALKNLGALYLVQARFTEAEPFYVSSLALLEKSLGPDHKDVGRILSSLGTIYRDQGRYSEAELLFKRSLDITEKELGSQHPEVGRSLTSLARQYRVQGRYSEAEAMLRRSIVIFEVAKGTGHDLGRALVALGQQCFVEGRYTEAEHLLQRGLAVWEKVLRPEHPEIGTSLNSLAELYLLQSRAAEAEPLFKRGLAIFEKALGVDHPYVGAALTSLGTLYLAQGRYAEAEPAFKRSLVIRETSLGSDHVDVSHSLNNLALLQSELGHYPEAELLLKRSLAISETALGPRHPDIAIRLSSLAGLYLAQQQHAEANPLYNRAIAIFESALGPEHPHLSAALDSLAWSHFVQGDWVGAANSWRRSTGIIARRSQRGTDDVGQALTGKRKGEAELSNYRFWALTKAAYRLVGQESSAEVTLARETFQTAQWALGSEAGRSLAQMAARGSKGDALLAALVRERQDLVEEWQKRNAVRTAAVSQKPDKRDRTADATNAARLTAIDTRIVAIDKRMIMEFPDYAALARPLPLTVQEVQAQLRSDEALVLFLDTPDWTPTPEETFIWVVTKADMRWVRSDLGTPALQREVTSLRCGLDAVLWDDDAASKRCRELLNATPERDVHGNIRTETLPVDAARAHALYKALFGQIEDLIRDKHLLIVPSGPLTQLPFQVLVTAPHSDGRDYRATKWLARQNAITVLPAVSSLKALRRVARASSATRAMLGIGNPLLDGNPAERPWEAKWAQLARDKQGCPQTVWQRVAGLVEKRRSVQKVVTHSGRADLDHLKSQSPLSDTADELCAVAKDLRLSADDILLGANATEATLKTLSATGKLAQYRVLHFATHGTIAGEIEGTSEPGLILTPPKEQSDEDDGYLSASEVAALKLDADWVILSACNTAAGGAQGAEALSGLARAFIYSGARALLVSHWSVSSGATVSLITHAVGAISRDKKLGRAEALRRAMLAMIDKGKPHEAHPAYWAPFVVIGEGAATR